MCRRLTGLPCLVDEEEGNAGTEAVMMDLEQADMIIESQETQAQVNRNTPHLLIPPFTLRTTCLSFHTSPSKSLSHSSLVISLSLQNQ